MLFLLFFIIPIVEMYLLIEVAQQIEVLPTVLLVMLTAVVGVAMLRQQGFSTLTRGISRMNQGEIPAMEMFEGILLAVAGAFLITPGFLTDSIGFVLTLGPTRRVFARFLLHRFKLRSVSGFSAERDQQNYSMEGKPVPKANVIEGEFEKKD